MRRGTPTKFFLIGSLFGEGGLEAVVRVTPYDGQVPTREVRRLCKTRQEARAALQALTNEVIKEVARDGGEVVSIDLDV